MDHFETYLYGLNENRHAAESRLRNRLLSTGCAFVQKSAERIAGTTKGKSCCKQALHRPGNLVREHKRSVPISCTWKLATVSAAPWLPRLSVIYDYASGDRNPLD